MLTSLICLLGFCDQGKAPRDYWDASWETKTAAWGKYCCSAAISFQILHSVFRTMSMFFFERTCLVLVQEVSPEMISSSILVQFIVKKT